MSTITSFFKEERDSSHFLEYFKIRALFKGALLIEEAGWGWGGGGVIKVMLKITEIIVAKIKIFGQDHGWILTKFAKQKNEANIQPF